MYKNKQTLLLTFLSTILWLLIAIATLPMVYMTNDDTSIQMALSGVHTGTPYPYHQFINSFLGHIIAGLYSITTTIPWWYIWSILCVLIGIFCIHWTIIKNSISKCESLLLICIFGLSFWIFTLSNIAFTVVPCIFSLGIIFLLFSNDAPRWNYPFICFSCIVILISNWHRLYSGCVMLCYFGMGLLYYIIHCTNLNIKQKILRFLGTFGITIILVFVTVQIDNIVKEYINPDTFTAFNEGRIDYMDYPHITYNENPQIFGNYGWNKNLASLVSDWCFLDERVTTEAFRGICGADPLYDINESNTIDLAQNSFISPLLSLLKENNYAIYLTCFFISIALFGELYIYLSGFLISKINFFFISNTGGSLLLLLYLIYDKRLPLRAYMIILIPMILISCLLILKIRASSKKNPANNFLWCLNLGILLILTIPSFLYNYEPEALNKKILNIETCNAIDIYLEENNQNIYIADIISYDNINPFNHSSHNLIWWGGSTYHSEYFYLHLQNNNLSKLNMETFKQNNVYMLTSTSTIEEYSSTLQKLFDCLIEYNAIYMEKIDFINETRGVYKFTFDETLNGYTGFYEIGEYTFYYIDGIRQTESFTLNGINYECGNQNLVLNGKQLINTKGYIKNK